MMRMLAAARGRSIGDLAGDVFPWLAALAVLVIVGFVLASLIRRRFQATESGGQMLTLHDFRRMRDTGEISEAEFERIRAGIIAAAKGSAASEKPGDGSHKASSDDAADGRDDADDDGASPRREDGGELPH
jgi:hypothetical protein